ncbi:GNAT family N-acetyltransferase [Streptomyces sp. NPDC058426]|uniref:GNAT family N-acetyltransferase n=1 Tax=unclassified Streptomyces TaxID=2593676 RepID=UPI00365AB4A8
MNESDALRDGDGDEGRAGAPARFAACRTEDVALLDAHLPSGQATSFHARRFARQCAGGSTYLVAWTDGVPVGNGEVRWGGCAAPEVREALGDCPEINGLDVVAELRGRGIGTGLIRHAEALAVRRGTARIGLGVDETGNPGAARLYARLGYRPAVRYLDRWSYVDHDGTEHQQADPTLFLIKEFDGGAA